MPNLEEFDVIEVINLDWLKFCLFFVHRVFLACFPVSFCSPFLVATKPTFWGNRLGPAAPCGPAAPLPFGPRLCVS
jgi:hypothetical protein